MKKWKWLKVVFIFYSHLIFCLPPISQSSIWFLFPLYLSIKKQVLSDPHHTSYLSLTNGKTTITTKPISTTHSHTHHLYSPPPTTQIHHLPKFTTNTVTEIPTHSHTYCPYSPPPTTQIQAYNLSSPPSTSTTNTHIHNNTHRQPLTCKWVQNPHYHPNPSPTATSTIRFHHQPQIHDPNQPRNWSCWGEK